MVGFLILGNQSTFQVEQTCHDGSKIYDVNDHMVHSSRILSLDGEQILPKLAGQGWFKPACHENTKVSQYEDIDSARTYISPPCVRTIATQIVVTSDDERICCVAFPVVCNAE